MSKKIVATIEARMTSSRLPGKVLMPAFENISMLEFMINRVKQSKYIDQVIVATTTNSTDDPIVELCDKLGLSYFRGSEPDVLLRVLEAHKQYESDVIVELTGDCPLIDPEITDQVIETYLNKNCDYVSNCHVRSFPDGLDVQVFSTKVLDEVSNKTQDQYDRENVSSYIYRSGEYTLESIIAEGDLHWPELRITLDDKGDYELIKIVIENLYPEKGYGFSAMEIINFLKGNPEVMKLLEDVRVTDYAYQTVSAKKDQE